MIESPVVSQEPQRDDSNNQQLSIGSLLVFVEFSYRILRWLLVPIV